MKKLFCSKVGKTVLAWLLVVCMVVPMLPSGSIAKAAEDSDYNYHNMSMKEILGLKDRSLTWVFAGDSITHNGSWSGGMNSYSEWFEQYLYDIGRGDDSVVLTAWGGADTQDFLYKADTPSGNGVFADPGMGLEKMITSYNPDVVFIKLGMNDRGKTTAQFEQFYNKILDGVYAEGAKNNKVPKIVIITPTPLASENAYDDTIHTERDDAILETILRFRDKLEKIAAQRDLLFCDLRTAFVEESKRLGENYAHTFFSDSSDGLHPNVAGQYLIFKTLSKAIGIYDETMPIFQVEYEDCLSQALYVGSTDGVTYTGDYGSTSGWNTTIATNNVWGVAGANQMSGYEGAVVNRSLFRYLDNAMRGGANAQASQRDIRMFNFASPEYKNGVQDLLANYDKIMAARDYNVFLLLPEIPNVYESSYEHSDEKVAEYKSNVLALLNKNAGKVKVLWTPLASGDEVINSFIDDYATAVREIVTDDPSILFFDANRFMNDNMAAIPALSRNWFEDGAYVSPLCSVDVAYAFYTLMNQSGIAKSELSDHNLRFTSDKQIYKGNYVRDYVKADTVVEGTTVTVDASKIKAAYPQIINLKLAVMPEKGTGNYHADIRYLDEIANITVSGDVYTFEAPCADLHLAIYGEQNGLIYQFKDISLLVDTTATIPETKAAEPDGVYLDSLKVMSAPDFGFTKDTTEYTVDLYQYQTYARVRATAQAGLTITINGETVASNALSDLIKVEDGSKIEVKVSNGTETKTYTLNCSKPENPDIIITEIMQDGYMNYTKGGNDNYELVEIYNASGRDLNLLDYSLGFKKDYTYNKITVSNGAEYPYYFTGNDQAFSGNATHTGIKPLTKYSIYWKDKVDAEPKEVLFPADSTMVIWLRYAPQKTQAERETYGAALTYDTLREALEKHKGTHTLSVDVDGVDTAVVPKESQLVVAELPYDAQSGGLSSRAAVTPEKAQQNFYMDNFGGYYAYQSTRGWLFILKDTAKLASNGAVTAAGDDIVSAAKFSRAARDNGDGTTQGTDKLSSVFSYNHERGMSLVKDESVVYADKIGVGNTSDVMGYSNLTSFGAIEYWQKPAEFGDEEAPTIVDNTARNVSRGSSASIEFNLADNKDVRYAELYVRRAGESGFTKVTKDFVLEAGIKNAGLSKAITDTTYSYTIDNVTDKVEYYAKVVDGNNNTATIGSVEAPLAITTTLKTVQTYSKEEALTYVGIKAPECKSEGYIFAGWYADKACEKAPIRSAEEVTGTSYALFVTRDVLSVKAQIADHMEDTDATNDATGAIRFVTTVDTLNYKQVGFKIAFDKAGTGEIKKYISSSDKVYTQLQVMNSDIIYPSEFCDISTYFKACTVKNVAEDYYELDFNVTPFWITLDGVEVEGVSAVKVINNRIASKYEAKDNTKYYTTLEGAVEAAQTTEADTITVMRDAEVESPMTIKADTNVTIQNRAKRNITIYRGTGLAKANTFTVEQGAVLTIAGSESENSLVLDGRTKAEAEANTGRDNVAASTGSLINNSGTLNLTNVTAQYARRTGDGAVVYNQSSTGASVHVNHAKFANNKTSAAGGAMFFGSGNKVSELNDVIFMDNAATTNGGAISNYFTLTLTDCKFTKNQSTGTGNGGAIYSGSSAVVTITGTNPEMAIFENNTTTKGYGGAIGIGSGKVVIDGYRFIGNRASTYGGAFYLTGSNENYSEIKNTHFEENRASANNGGAIHLQGTGRLNLTDCDFYKNHAQVRGGALHVEGGKVNVTNTNFVENDAKTEGGAFRIAGGGTAIFKNGKFESNDGGTMGGAIKYNTGTLTITNYVFTGNTATSGNDIRLNTAFASNPTLIGCTFNPSGIVDSNGKTGTYKDGGGNTIITE